MGLFDVKSGSSGYEQTTTQKNLPNYVTPVVNTWYNDLVNYQRSNPNDYITPINDIQARIFGQAGADADTLRTMTNDPSRLFLGPADPSQYQYGSLPSASGYYTDAIDMARNVGDPSLTQAGLPGQYDTQNVADIGNRQYATANVGNLGDATQARYTGYQGPQLGNASTWQGQGYNAATIDPSVMGARQEYLGGDAAQAQSASLLDNFDAYMNPYLSDVVNTSLAEYDQNLAQEQARRDALAAKNRAFGGSAYEIGSAQFDSDAQRQRASLDAGLRAQGFDTAAGLSNLDTARRQETSQFNATQSNQRDIARGQIQSTYDLGRAGLAMEAAGINVDALNSARSFAASARNQSEQDAATAQNKFRLEQAGFDRDSAQYLADAANLSERDYAAAINDIAKTRFTEQNTMNRYNTDAQNAAYADTYAAEGAAARQNADAENARRGQVYSTEADTMRFNAGQANEMEQYIASLGLDRANTLGNLATQYGTDSRAQTQQQLDIGNLLWEMQQQRQNAGLTQLQNTANMIDPALINAITGQSIDTRKAGTITEGANGLDFIKAGVSLL